MRRSRAWPAPTGGNADAYRSGPNDGYLLPLVMGGMDSSLRGSACGRTACVCHTAVSCSVEPRQESSKPNNLPHYTSDWCRQAANRIRNSIGEATPSSKSPLVASWPSPLFDLDRGRSQGPLYLSQNFPANSSQSPSPTTPSSGHRSPLPELPQYDYGKL